MFTFIFILAVTMAVSGTVYLLKHSAGHALGLTSFIIFQNILLSSMMVSPGYVPSIKDMRSLVVAVRHKQYVLDLQVD